MQTILKKSNPWPERCRCRKCRLKEIKNFVKEKTRHFFKVFFSGVQKSLYFVQMAHHQLQICKPPKKPRVGCEYCSSNSEIRDTHWDGGVEAKLSHFFLPERNIKRSNHLSWIFCQNATLFVIKNRLLSWLLLLYKVILKMLLFKYMYFNS